MLWFKWGGIAAVVILLCGTSYRLGGAATRASSNAAHAQQLSAVVTVLEQREVATAAESRRRQGVIDAYDLQKDVRALPVVGLAERVYVATGNPVCRAVPAPGGPPGGTDASPPKPTRADRPQQITRQNQLVYDSCARDAQQLSALQAWILKPTSPKD